MLKKIPPLSLFLIINCFAQQMITCYDRGEEELALRNLINNLCGHINYNIRFITNPEYIEADDLIRQGFFTIIYQKNNTVLLPYNTVFKDIASEIFFSYINKYHSLIRSSQSVKLPNYSWLKQVNTISSLISSDIDHINQMFNAKPFAKNNKNVMLLPVNYINDNSLSINKINTPINKIFGCNNIDAEIPLGCKIMAILICNSKYFDKNIKFISDVNNVNLDKPIAEGFFVIINKKNDTAILPYNSIFKQLALLPKAEPYNFRNLFRFSKSLTTTAYAWLHKTNNISSLIQTKPYYAINMFTETKFHMPYTNNTMHRIIQFKTKEKVGFYVIGIFVGIFATSIFGVIYYKIFRNKKK